MHGTLSGVSYIHEKGIIHMDIKPENILIGKAHEPKVGDFGIAIHFMDVSSRVGCGTSGYWAPEQMGTAGDQRLNHKIDIWPCGVVAFMVCTLSFPWTDGETPSRQRDVDVDLKHGFASPLWEHRRPLDDVVRLACRVDVDERANADDCRRLLDDLVSAKAASGAPRSSSGKAADRLLHKMNKRGEAHNVGP